MAKPPTRTEVQGWTLHSIRRNTQFLYSVEEAELGHLKGAALTLTVKDTPASGEEWAKLRHRWLQAIYRDGAVLVHWVTEWQRRGAPHMHCSVFWHHQQQAEKAIGHWLRIAKEFNPKRSGQHWNPIYDVLGWNQYVSKHASRGLFHYQRSPDSIPPGWRGKSTGRIWGTRGDWPTREPIEIDLPPKIGFMLRRVMRRRRISRVRLELTRCLAPVPGSNALSDPR